MSRSKKLTTRSIAADAIYNSELVAKFINTLMKRGKKTVAQDIVYGALEQLEEKKKEQPLKLFETAIETVRPHIEIRSRRVGGANYQVPMPVSGRRQNALAFRWILGAAKARKGRGMKEKLSAELFDILEGVGGAIKKKEDVHRMAEANKAFAHFARFSR